MRLHCGVDNRQLMRMLEDALLKERVAWKPQLYKPKGDVETEVGQEQRDGIVRWLALLNQKFHFHPETFALSVTILDRFLHAVKARPKYLRCIAISCFYIAAKTLEEDEVIPVTLELVKESQCDCTKSELLRMERIILEKLNWNIRTITALDFLHIFHALLLSNVPHLLDRYRHMTASRQLSLLTTKLQLCVAHAPLQVFRPSTVALALLSLELELCQPDWLSSTLMMQTMVQVDNNHLIRCRELVSGHLVAKNQTNTVYIYMPIASKPAKRKVEAIEVDDIYDGIKRLYNDENILEGAPPVAAAAAAAMLLTSCASEAHQEPDDSSCPPLQTIPAN